MSFDPRKAKPYVRAAIIVAVVATAALLYRSYGWARVPEAVDSMLPDLPPGTLCFIQKDPTELPAGAVVFVELEGRGLFVTRVQTVEGDLVVAQHDNPRSRIGFGRQRGTVPRAAVRGLVLTAFAEDPR